MKRSFYDVSFILPPVSSFSPYLVPCHRSVFGGYLAKKDVSFNFVDLNIKFLKELYDGIRKPGFTGCVEKQIEKIEKCGNASLDNEEYISLIKKHMIMSDPNKKMSYFDLCDYLPDQFMRDYWEMDCATFDDLQHLVDDDSALPFVSEYISKYSNTADYDDVCNSKVVGINVAYCHQLVCALKLAKEVKKKNSDAFIVFGGPHMTLTCRNYASKYFEFKALDAICVYSGEEALYKLFRGVKDGRSVDDIPNIVTRRNMMSPLIGSKTHLNDLKPLIHKPESVYEHYTHDARIMVLCAKGCYWNKCRYCNYTLLQEDVVCKCQARSPELVAEEIEEYCNLGFDDFWLVGDSISRKYYVELSELLLKRKLKARLFGLYRIEKNADENALLNSFKKMRQAGFRQVSIGVEAVDDDQLKSANKGYSVNDVLKALRLFFEAGIIAEVQLVPDLPGVTANIMKTSLALIRDNKDYFQTIVINKFMLLKDTEYYNSPDSYDIEIVDDYNQLNCAIAYRNMRIKENTCSRYVDQYRELYHELKLHRASRDVLKEMDHKGGFLRNASFRFRQIVFRQLPSVEGSPISVYNHHLHRMFFLEPTYYEMLGFIAESAQSWIPAEAIIEGGHFNSEDECKSAIYEMAAMGFVERIKYL